MANIGEGSGFHYGPVSLTDNYGNSYSSAFYSIGSLEGRTEAEYLLNNQYSRFKGTLCIEKGESSGNAVRMEVIANGKKIYSSPEMNKTSAPVDFDVNVEGYHHIELKF